MSDLFRYTAGAASCSVGLALLWMVVNVRPEHREWPEVDVLMAGIAFIIGAWYLLLGCGLLWMTSRNRYSTAPEFRRLTGGLYLSLLVLTMILTWISTQIFTAVHLSIMEIIYLNLLLVGLIGAILLFLSTEVGNALAARPRFRVTHLVFSVLLIAITSGWNVLSVEADILLVVVLFVLVLFHFGLLTVTVRPQSRFYRLLLDAGHLLFGVLIAILAYMLVTWFAPTSRLIIIATLLLVVILPPYLGWLYLGAISADEVYAEEV